MSMNDESCACGHPYGTHTNGREGPCGMARCQCTGFTRIPSSVTVEPSVVTMISVCNCGHTKVSHQLNGPCIVCMCSAFTALGTAHAEAVDHPKHYNMGKIEVIDAVEDWGLGFNDGNAIKYIARARHKGKALEDLKKAAWYITREIQRLGEIP